MGAAYASLSNAPLDVQKRLFPTDASAAPYKATSSLKATAASARSKATDLFKADKFTFPYTWKQDGGVKEWFANSIEYSYIPGRKFIRGALEITSSPLDEKNLNEGASYGLATMTGMFIISAFTTLSQFYGTISTLLGQFLGGEGAWIYGLIFFFLFGLGPAAAGIVGGVQSIQTFVALAIMPLVNNWPTVKKIMRNNLKTYMVVLSVFILIDALGTLPLSAFIGMFVVFCIGLTIGMF
jgi:hypothetical protein